MSTLMTAIKTTKALQWGVACALVAVCALTLFGCATENSGSTTSDQDEYSAVEDATPTTRTITFPAVYFGDLSSEEAIAQLEDAGCTDVVDNGDGSYTATMPLDLYNSMVDEVYASAKSSLDAIPNSEDYPSITAVEYDDTLANITFTSSESELGLQEMFVNWVAAIYACMYQQLAGQPVQCTVTVVDGDGNTVQEGTYPDDWEAAGEDAPSFQSNEDAVK